MSNFSPDTKRQILLDLDKISALASAILVTNLASDDVDTTIAGKASQIESLADNLFFHIDSL